MIQALAPIAPEVLQGNKVVKEAAKAEERAAKNAEPITESESMRSRPTHPDAVGRMVNVEA